TYDWHASRTGLSFHRLRTRASGFRNQSASENFSSFVGGDRFSAPETGITQQVAHRPSPPHHFHSLASASRAASPRRDPSQTSISLPLMTQRTRRRSRFGFAAMSGIIRAGGRLQSAAMRGRMLLGLFLLAGARAAAVRADAPAGFTLVAVKPGVYAAIAQ